MKRYIDLTHTISNDTPSSPFDNKIILEKVKFLDKDHYNDTRMITTMHIGTHIDAPSHMINDGKHIDEFHISNFFGKGIALNFENKQNIVMKPEFEELDFFNKIVVIYTNQDKEIGNSNYYLDHPIISEELCDYLISKQIKIIGLDFFSPDKTPSVIHKKFLSNDILIVENLCNLDLLIDKNDFDLVLIPTKIKAEGAFVRAAAIIDE